jgi:hypothetical protein
MIPSPLLLQPSLMKAPVKRQEHSSLQRKELITMTAGLAFINQYLARTPYVRKLPRVPPCSELSRTRLHHEVTKDNIRVQNEIHLLALAERPSRQFRAQFRARFIRRSARHLPRASFHNHGKNSLWLSRQAGDNIPPNQYTTDHCAASVGHLETIHETRYGWAVVRSILLFRENDCVRADSRR